MAEMTKSDRDTLIKIARQRERVAKSSAKERSKQLIADFEEQLDRRYSFDENEVWAAAEASVSAALEKAQDQIAAECERIGIPKEFAPSINAGWWDRGRNAAKSERSDMRKVAIAQIQALEQKAIAAIERRSVETQEQIMVGGLTTADAKMFLESMPTADTLMPGLSLDHVRTLMLEKKNA